MKIVINSCFGGFGLSNKAIKRYLELKGKECFFYEAIDSIYTYKKVDENSEGILIMIFTKDFGNEFKSPKFKQGGPQSKEYNDMWDFYFYDRGIERNDLDLIKVVEELGKEANGEHAELKIIEIPDIKYEIDEYDGIESIHEVHRSWS